MSHGAERLAERMTDAGIPAGSQARALDFFRSVAARRSDDVAVIARHREQVGQPWSDRSNGDLIVAILRGGAVSTVFLRRSTQTNTVDSLRVSAIIQVPDNVWRQVVE